MIIIVSAQLKSYLIIMNNTLELVTNILPSLLQSILNIISMDKHKCILVEVL